MLRNVQALKSRAAAVASQNVGRLTVFMERVARAARTWLERHTTGLRRWWREAAWPLLEPAWARVDRVGSWVTGMGWGVILVTLGFAWIGWWMAWEELAAIAVIGGFLLAGSSLFLAGRIAYSASVDLTRTRVVVGEQAVGAITVVNPGSRALRPVEVTLPVGRGVASFMIPRLEPEESHEDLFQIPTQKRAVLPVGPISAVRGDPLGILARVVTWSRPVDLFVHPKTVGLEGSSAGILQDLEGLPSRELSSSDLSFHAIREYVPGDDRRHVHWRSTARTGVLMVRQFEETRRSHLAVVLSLLEEEYSSEEEFEMAISIAGSVGLQALREDRQVTVLVQGASLPTRTGKRFLDSLSGLEAVPARRGGIVHLSLEVAVQVPDASVAILVCGTNVSPQHILKASSSIPAGVILIAVYCELGAKVAVGRVGEVSVLTVGDLRDLPRALRRVMA